MKIYDKDKLNIIENPDLTLGYLLNDRLVIGYTDVVEPKEEKFHYEVINEYPNGGKDVVKIVDEEAVQYQAPQPIYEDIQIYIPFTQEELNANRMTYIVDRLSELTKDFAQIHAGLIIDDIEDRKLEFQSLLNEIRVLQGKEPREIANN